jgi:hypothetical protein
LFIVYLFFINKANSGLVFNTGRHDRAIELRNSSIIDVFNTGLESVILKVFFYKKKKTHAKLYYLIILWNKKKNGSPV